MKMPYCLLYNFSSFEVNALKKKMSPIPNCTVRGIEPNEINIPIYQLGNTGTPVKGKPMMAAFTDRKIAYIAADNPMIFNLMHEIIKQGSGTGVLYARRTDFNEKWDIQYLYTQLIEEENNLYRKGSR